MNTKRNFYIYVKFCVKLVREDGDRELMVVKVRDPFLFISASALKRKPLCSRSRLLRLRKILESALLYQQKVDVRIYVYQHLGGGGMVFYLLTIYSIIP